MSDITIRVPEDLKSRMERCGGINWSEVARRAFEEAARRKEVKCAAESIKKLRDDTEAGWDGAKKIRKWRNAAK